MYRPQERTRIGGMFKYVYGSNDFEFAKLCWSLFNSPVEYLQAPRSCPLYRAESHVQAQGDDAIVLSGSHEQGAHIASHVQHALAADAVNVYGLGDMVEYLKTPF
jgi:hypothetical protein